ncbi:hypothetical protein HK101_010877 [Irineochytrium annulatum]|nr:hypothetical protein HK101_010877 [Irineochytrium annulatum]
MKGLPPAVGYAVVLIVLGALIAYQTYVSIDKFRTRLLNPPIQSSSPAMTSFPSPAVTICTNGTDLTFQCFTGTGEAQIPNCQDKYVTRFMATNVFHNAFDRCYRVLTVKQEVVLRSSQQGPLYYPFNLNFVPTGNSTPFNNFYYISLADPSMDFSNSSYINNMPIFPKKLDDVYKLAIGFTRSSYTKLSQVSFSATQPTTLDVNSADTTWDMTFSLLDLNINGQLLPDSDWFKIGIYPTSWRVFSQVETDPYPPFVFLSNLFASWGFAFASFYFLLGRGRYNPGGILQKVGIVDSQVNKIKYGRMEIMADPAVEVVSLYLDGADKLISSANKRAPHRTSQLYVSPPAFASTPAAPRTRPGIRESVSQFLGTGGDSSASHAMQGVAHGEQGPTPAYYATGTQEQQLEAHAPASSNVFVPNPSAEQVPAPATAAFVPYDVEHGSAAADAKRYSHASQLAAGQQGSPVVATTQRLSYQPGM